MAAWTHLRRLTAVAVGSGTGLVVYKYFQSPHVVDASWTNSSKPVNPSAIWDSNWDCRDPKSMVRPVKNDTPEEQNRYNCELEKVVPKAVRHIVLVRHGEYLDEGPHDKDHHLTERGRLQTKYTGQRLKQLGFEWDKVIASTMTRAQETLEIVLKEINYDLKAVSHCRMLREGAPIEPQPPVGHWRPEQSRLILKQVWREKLIWEGFLKCLQRLKPQSLPIMLHLPPQHLMDALQKCPELRAPLLEYAESIQDEPMSGITPQIMDVINGTAVDVFVTDESGGYISVENIKQELEDPDFPTVISTVPVLAAVPAPVPAALNATLSDPRQPLPPGED